MTDDLVFTKDRNLQVAEPKLVTERGQEAVKRSDIQFIDLRGFDGTVERTVTSRVSTTFSSTAISELSSSHEQTWTVGGKIGGHIGEKNKPGANAEISAQFQDKVVNALRNSYQSTVTSVWEKSVSDKLLFKAGKLYVLETVWSLTLDKGTATYLGERSTYTVVRSADAELLKPSGYDSEEKLPEEYRNKWQKRAA
jgi:Asp/Glu/hydantoin racemase